MKRFLLFALVFMQTPNERVIYDLSRNSTYHSDTDTLVFTYADSYLEGESQIEVTEGSGYSEPETKDSTETTEDRTETFTLSPEMEQVMDYWDQFRK